jgi:type 1 glutamine amidotransferase
MRNYLSILVLCFVTIVTIANPIAEPIHILVITGGHSYKVEQFNQMLSGLADNISYQVAEFPAAYDMFLPENRTKYDVLVFYHMWQKITDEQAKVFAECISEGKPVVALHHSICAYDEWPEYWNIIGGKYFHNTTTFKGQEHQPGSYMHDLHFNVTSSHYQ